MHLAGATGEDSRSVQRIADCRKALQEINNGDALHMIQLTIAVAADDLYTLKERVQTVQLIDQRQSSPFTRFIYCIYFTCVLFWI